MTTFVALEGCVADDSGSDQASHNQVSSENPASKLPAPVPSLHAAGLCSHVDEFTTCEWVQAMDAFVLGRVEAIRPRLAPVYDSTSGKILDTCDGGNFLPSVEVDVRVAEVFSGSIAAKELLTVHVPPETVASWNFYYWPGTDEMVWGRIGGEPRLQEGELIGLPLWHSQEPGMWTLGSEPLWATWQNDDGEAVSFQGWNGCRKVSPNFSGMKLGEVLSSVRTCAAVEHDSQAAEKYRTLARPSSFELTTASFGALCVGPPPGVEPVFCEDEECESEFVDTP